MKKTLYIKFLIAYLIFGFFAFVIVATFVSNMTKNLLIQNKAESLYTEATLIADTYATDLYNSKTSLDIVKREIDMLDAYLDSTIWIISPSGSIILDSDSPVDIDNPRVISGFDPTSNTGNYYTIGTYFDSFEEEVLSVSAPITIHYRVQGYVVIHSSMASLDEFVNQLLNVSYIMLAIFFLLSLIVLIFFTNMVYIPLRKITTATEQYANGNLHYEFQVDSEDEIGYLAASLSFMASELARGEDDQKKLVANVSHDFRSPLTSIKGYSEAMLDGTIPQEMHEKYLTIVRDESDRLIKLTNSLLTLNNLNTDGMVLDKSDFDINRIIRKTVATFEGSCRNKKISLNLVLTGEKLLVNADMDKIQQVLYNLIDNAIKFSNKDSEIKIETTVKHNKVFISVKDQGIGIPKESIRQIWDRFYKTDLSRGKDKKAPV